MSELDLMNIVCFYFVNGKRTLQSITKSFFKDFCKEDVLSYLPKIKSIFNSIEEIDQEKRLKLAESVNLNVIGCAKRIHYLEKVPENSVVRFAPSPSGMIHLAHHRILYLNEVIRLKKNGKSILRIENTDLDKCRYGDEIIQFLTSLFTFDEVHKQSDRLEIYSQHLKLLFENGGAVYCTCSQEQLTQNRLTSTFCLHHQINSSKGLEGYNNFMTNKTGIAKLVCPSSNDPSCFDIVLARFKSDTFSPMMNFAVSVDDYLMGVTLSIRGPDHKSNAPKQALIRQRLGYTFDIQEIYLGPVFSDSIMSSSKLPADSPFFLNNFIKDYSLESLNKFWESKGFSQSEVVLDISQFKKG